MPDYRALLTEASASLVRTQGVLPFAHIRKVRDCREAAAALAHESVDFVLLSAQERGAPEAARAAAASAAVLLLGELPDEERKECLSHGILVFPETEIALALTSLCAMRERLRALETQANTLRRKLDDTRIVNRAKMLLMSQLKMSEQEAHRYIEKAAMDTGAKRRSVAESIIRTYEA